MILPLDGQNGDARDREQRMQESKPSNYALSPTAMLQHDRLIILVSGMSKETSSPLPRTVKVKNVLSAIVLAATATNAVRDQLDH
jgi:hypothetical protein